MSNVQKALAVCVEAHMNQIDRDGLPHSFHCIRVALHQDSDNRMCIALLHDVLEDCPDWTMQRLEQEFGFQIAFTVGLLSRPEGQSWSQYLAQIMGPAHIMWNQHTDKARAFALKRAHEDAMHVKLSDIEDNVSPRRLDDKMRRQLEMYHEGYKMIAKRLGYTDKVLPL